MIFNNNPLIFPLLKNIYNFFLMFVKDKKEKWQYHDPQNVQLQNKNN